MPILITSFLITLVLIVLCSVVFRKLKWLDEPERFGYSRAPVPYGVGIVFYLVLVALGSWYLEWNQQFFGLVIGGGMLTVMCFLDDRWKLPALPRLGIQLLCALIVVLSGVGVPAISNPFGDPIVLDSIRWSFELWGLSFVLEPMADAVAVIWILFVINAMNWLDGVPGMVSGMSSIAGLVMYLLATGAVVHLIDQSELMTMSLILLGSTLAFWIFDFPSPKVLMGDSGTMFLGFLLGTMAISSGGKLATAFIVLAFPLMDAIWTVLRRIMNKKNPLKGDFEHFHHELMKAGLTEAQVNAMYYLFALGFGIVALSLQSTGKFLALLVLFTAMAGLRLALRRKRRLRSGN